MQKYEHNLTANTGGALRPLSGASIVVTDGASGLPASIYSDNGTTPLQQPLATDNDGYFGFYAADGKYTLTFTSPRFETFTREIVMDDPLDDPYATLAQLAAPTGSSIINHGDMPISEVLDSLVNEVEELSEIADRVLPVASSTALGGVKVGANLSIDNNGILSAASAGATIPLAEMKVNSTSPVAQLDFLNVFSAVYDKYVIEVSGLRMSNPDSLRLQTAIAGAVQTLANCYGATDPGSTHATPLVSFLIDTQVGIANYTIEITNANGSTAKAINVRGCKNTTNGGPRMAAGFTSGTSSLSGFRLFPVSNGITFTDGIVRVSGIKNP